MCGRRTGEHPHPGPHRAAANKPSGRCGQLGYRDIKRGGERVRGHGVSCMGDSVVEQPRDGMSHCAVGALVVCSVPRRLHQHESDGDRHHRDNHSCDKSSCSKRKCVVGSLQCHHDASFRFEGCARVTAAGSLAPPVGSEAVCRRKRIIGIAACIDKSRKSIALFPLATRSSRGIVPHGVRCAIGGDRSRASKPSGDNGAP